MLGVCILTNYKQIFTNKTIKSKYHFKARILIIKQNILKMLTRIDDDSESEPVNPDNLLTDWVAEQSARLNKISAQIRAISNLPEDRLDELCNHLDDIDYHTAGLSNILDLVVYVPDAQIISDSENNCLDDHYSEETPPTGRWPLLYALWFHMMMQTDPDSIYYSPNINIGRDNWPTDFK